MTQDLSSSQRTNTTTNPKTTSPASSKSPASRKKSREYGTWFHDPYNHVRGENALWVAVITQAMMDALSRSQNTEALYHKHEAIRWLSDNSKDFVQVCLFAGMDPDYVRRKAKRALAAPTSWRAEAGKGKRYLERKAYRKRLRESQASATAPEESEGKIIVGPWPINTAAIQDIC